MCKGPSVKRIDLTFHIVAPSFTGCLSLGKKVSVASSPGLPVYKRADSHVYLQELLNVRVIGAHPRSCFPVGNSHSWSSHDCPGVRTRWFSFGNLFSCAACLPGPQHLFLTVLARMFWGSCNLVLRKDLTTLTVHLKVSHNRDDQWHLGACFLNTKPVLAKAASRSAPYGWFTKRGD